MSFLDLVKWFFEFALSGFWKFLGCILLVRVITLWRPLLLWSQETKTKNVFKHKDKSPDEEETGKRIVELLRDFADQDAKVK